MKIAVITALSLIVGIGRTEAQAVDPYESQIRKMLEQYFELLKTDNFESASYLWNEDSRDRSSRFGIVFENIPLKTDARSPFMRFFDKIRYEQVPPRLMVTQQADSLYKVEYSQFLSGEVLRHDYYVTSAGGYLRLIYPQNFYAKEWKLFESRFVRIHVHPGVAHFVNDALLEEVDEYVSRLSGLLGLSGDDMTLLESKKIEYYYCDTDKTVEKITGSLVKGTLDLASNDIISAGFPHFHELVHFLVNFRLKTIPLYTIPLFREGIAVHLGGRWGKAPAALTDLSVFLYRERLVELDSVLTMVGFGQDAEADIAYPLAGTFTAFLVSKAGMERYLRLYRNLSGDVAKLQALSHDDIAARIAAALKMDDWSDVIRSFNDYLDELQTGNRSASVGEIRQGRVVFEIPACKVSENDQWVGFEFRDAMPGGEGSLLFGADSRFGNERSRLFDEQFGEKRKFGSWRFGIRFDHHEAGLYDYATNQLVAKHIEGISPKGDYLNGDSTNIRFRVRRELLGNIRPSKGDYLLLGE